MNIQYSWMAFVPVLNVFNLVKIAGLSYWWILGMLIPIWNIYAIIKVYHGISKNTGHGAWWTVGLMFSTFIFLPVTAFHYLPGDEINPRPFTGWKKVVLILLPLGVPILLILSIILPSFLAHQSRSMDAMRISQILDISSSLSTYFFDTEKYPTTPSSGCIPYDILKSK